MAVCLARQGHQLHAGRACIMDVRYGTVAVSDNGWSLSVLSVEMRLFVVVVLYTWSATVRERDSHQTARCTAETAQHLESRQSAERNRLKRRPTVRVVKQLSRRRLDWLQTLSVTTSSECRNRRSVCRATTAVVAAWLSAMSATAAEVSCTTKPTAQIELKSRKARFWLVQLISYIHNVGRWQHSTHQKCYC